MVVSLKLCQCYCWYEVGFFLSSYMDTANSLDQETNMGLHRFEVCDNIDLETILMEYESYYYVKFQRFPKLTKKAADSGRSNQLLCCGLERNVSAINKCGDGPHTKRIIDFRSLIQDAVKNEVSLNSLSYNQDPSERLIKPLGAFLGANSELRELAVVISRDIYHHNPNVTWDSIIGLDAAKRLVKEAVVYPIKYPQLFTGILSPWKGLLLYGPPGTGKTLLAKAVATECNTTFFNISASTIVSKWRGDSEKLVRVLFELARFHAPSTIFLDELESVMSQRGIGPGELDHAMLRRLEKRILVDLPTTEARQVMIQHWLPPVSNSGGVELRTQLDYSLLGDKTEGYSGSDIKLVCKEAAMRPVRKIFDALENPQTEKNPLPNIKLETVTTEDILEVIAHTKPSAKKLSQKYTAWQSDYESV
uniref:Katanin p60 ATPase-containing subunit A-like 2 n=1 Tax=Callorhinchus milii TaxID=7868 RepID=A0A4W3HKX6_CALMI